MTDTITQQPENTAHAICAIFGHTPHPATKRGRIYYDGKLSKGGAIYPRAAEQRSKTPTQEAIDRRSQRGNWVVSPNREPPTPEWFDSAFSW